MSWQALLQAQRIKSHRTSRQELDDLRNVVERDLQDAALPALSADRRFATAYNAVLQLGKMAIACAGYRVVGPGHHLTTFEAVEIAMGSSVSIRCHRPRGYWLWVCKPLKTTKTRSARTLMSETE